MHTSMTNELERETSELERRVGPYCLKRDLMARALECWMRLVADKVHLFLQEHWQDAHRCHICDYIGVVKYFQLCPSCGSRDRLSWIRFPLQRCHQCPFVGNPDFNQVCPCCDRRNTLSLYLVKKKYESEIDLSVAREA